MADRVIARLPEKIKTYFEPFLGGGAVFFELARQNRFKRAVLSDKNSQLINAWQTIQYKVEDLITELHKSEYQYDKEKYMSMREKSPVDMHPIKQAARFIYLNKAGFNGLYRVNKSGKFNVPFGRYEAPTICDESNLRAISSVLQSVEIASCGFNEIARKPKPGDAVYFDPPYLPKSDTSKFTNYTESGFTYEDHVNLAKIFQKITDKGVRAVLSNSMSEQAVQLYAGFDRDSVFGSRSIGGSTSSRKSSPEMIVFAGPLTKK